MKSYQFIPSNPEIKPYKHDIKAMYAKRLKLKKAGDDRQLPIKLILNSICSKTGQKVNGIIGNLFNPVIFAYITGYTRAQLYRFLACHNLCREVIGFATDSITVNKDLGIDSERVGEFSKGSCGDYIGLQNGFNRMNGEWKQRGFGRLNGRPVENVETAVRNGKLVLTLEVLRDTQIRSAIIQNRINDIGKIRPIKRELNLMADRKRFWLGRLESVNGKTWNDSLPLSLNHFSKQEI